MLKKDALFHYGIKKHICGSFYKEDCLVLGDDYLPLKYIYKQSALYMADVLQKKNPNVKYYVVRLD